jgi:predicted esterase
MKKDKFNIIINGENNYDSVLIFCHGLGDNSSSWIYFANQIKKKFNKLKIVLLQAPNNPVLINNNMIMPSWFDITEFPITKNYVDNGKYMNESFKIIHNNIDKEIENGILPKNIFIGGFSQGGALSLISGLKYDKEKIGGIIIMSGWIFSNTTLFDNYYEKDIPIFIGHGDNDKVVLYDCAEKLNNILINKKFSKVTFKKYNNMSHNSSNKEIDDIIDWLKNFII